MRLVQARYKISEYREEKEETKEELFTVNASSDAEAEQKVYDYFESISDPYGTYYHVYACDAIIHIS